MPHENDLFRETSSLFGLKRCVHCRTPLPPMAYHCAVCGRTVAEEIPSVPYTVELRITHNPTGQMVVLRDEPYSREPLERVDLRQLLGPFHRQLKLVLDQYPEPPSIEDIELPENIKEFTVEAARRWSQSLHDQIRAQRDKITLLDATNDPLDTRAMLEHAREVKRRADADEQGPHPDA